MTDDPVSPLLPPAPSFAEVQRRLRKAEETMSPQLRRAAAYMLAHPDDVALVSMRRLAEHAGVPPSTMVRLARAVGFDGFEALRVPFTDWIKGGDGVFSVRVRSLQGRHWDSGGDGASATASGEPDGADGHGAERAFDAAGLMRSVLAADRAGLERLQTPAMAEGVTRAGDEIWRGRQVYTIGLRSSFSVAHLFHYGYTLIRDNGVLVDGAGGTFMDNLRNIGASDVLLAISQRPYSRQTVLACRHARAQGASVVALTDRQDSPLAEGAAVTLLLPTESPGFYPTMVPAIAGVQLLLAYLAARGGTVALDRIQSTDRQMTGFEAYWPEPGTRTSRK